MSFKPRTHTQSKAADFIKQHPDFSEGMLIAVLLLIGILAQKFQKYKTHGFTRRGKLRKKIQAVFQPTGATAATAISFKTSYFWLRPLKINTTVNSIEIETAIGAVFNEQTARQLIEEAFSEYLVSYSGPLKGRHIFKLGKKL